MCRRERRASSGLAGPDSSLDDVVKVDENGKAVKPPVICQDETIEHIDLSRDESSDSVVEITPPLPRFRNNHWVIGPNDPSEDSVVELNPEDVENLLN